MMLKMEGFTFTGSDAKGVRWSGTGVWIRPGVLATNAYFIERATGVSAVDEQGHSVPLDTLLAWDPTNDLALLGTSAPAPKEEPLASLMPKPAGAEALKGTGLQALLEQEGKLASYSGRAGQLLSHVHGKPSVLLHDIRIPGARGELRQRYALFNAKDPRQLVGLNYGSYPSESAAVPAWTVQAVDEKSQQQKSRWVKLDKAFVRQSLTKLKRAPLHQQDAEGYMRPDTGGSSKVTACLSPGSKAEVPFHIVESRDLIVRVTTKPANARFSFALFEEVPAREGQGVPTLVKDCCEETTAKGSLDLIYTIPQSGTHSLHLGLPDSARGKVCFDITPEFVNWTGALP
ncbi:hypothetical protein [Archangium gephyra]|nr:hypothetical protein [Archangium gephyra]